MKDQLDRVLDIDKTPQRIISLVPSQTELLIDLGLESSIVGITKFCVHPNHLRKSKTLVGGTKQVHFDKIKTLAPDIILCNKEENTEQMVSELEGIATVHISDVNDMKDALELISQYGLLFNVREKASNLIDTIRYEHGLFQNYVNSKSTLKVAYFIWKNPWMVAAEQTFINSLLSCNGFENYFGNQTRYPEVVLDHISEDLDVILLSSEPYPFKGNDIEELQQKFPSIKIVLVDGEYFSWFGSRLKDAFRYFRELREKL